MTISLTTEEASEVRAALRSRVLGLRGSSSDHKPVEALFRRREKLIEALLERISPATARSAKGASA